MKKFIIALVTLCLILVAVVGATDLRGRVAEVPEPAEEEVSEPVEEVPSPALAADEEPEPDEVSVVVPEESEVSPPEEPAVESGYLDYEALFRLHDPNEVVLKVGDTEERWGDYFYVLYTQCGQIEDYFRSMAAYYGMRFGWTDTVEEGGEETYIDMALDGAENLTIQLRALELFSEKNNVELSEEILQKIEEEKQQNAVSALGEDATVEEFYEYLDGIYLTREMYDRILTQNYLYQESFNALYGENAEKLSEEAALEWLKENGYISAAHILFQTTDSETGEALSEEAKAEKRAQLEEILEELRAIEDPEERALAFLVKMDTLSEDPGKSYYPEGYTFTQGSMVQEFETAAMELEDYALSDIVETNYGYHILMRFPLSADAIVEFSNTDGTARTAKMLAANQEYSEKLQELSDSLELSWLPGYEEPDLQSFLAE